MRRISLGLLVLGAVLGFAPLHTAAKERVIFDTDFALPPQDDALALLLALGSREVEIVGVTTVAGNRSREQATVDALKVLEVCGCEHIPVFEGADMPLLHESSSLSQKMHGEWWSDKAPEMPPGGLAQHSAEDISAVEFIVDTVLENPGEINILAIGPLTNIAMAIRQNARFAQSVKKIFIMGGAIASLSDGAGNMTPNAEFNFWVDPEAARIVLRSGMEIELSPLNVSRKTAFGKDHFDQIIHAGTPVTDFLRKTMASRFEGRPDHQYLMYDQVAVASLIDPDIITARLLYVDVDANRGPNYGVSVGGEKIWPGAEGARQIRVQLRPRLGTLYSNVHTERESASPLVQLNSLQCSNSRNRKDDMRPDEGEVRIPHHVDHLFRRKLSTDSG